MLRRIRIVGSNFEFSQWDSIDHSRITSIRNTQRKKEIGREEVAGGDWWKEQNWGEREKKTQEETGKEIQH